ncbi:uncharacterized protein Triagg1_7698 [Trichoderma aggressivum f. europaeum]|uniref:Uncharacterized protein n=1 Tax=Trichoderma aggressivum f. europaeum TaxID=173218 RepID=A0AAE1I9F2_9HYPO|nr:hypothetical protein Triagg1_7698 [Trichoderma aggressivum f. europaeum]
MHKAAPPLRLGRPSGKSQRSHTSNTNSGEAEVQGCAGVEGGMSNEPSQHPLSTTVNSPNSRSAQQPDQQRDAQPDSDDGQQEQQQPNTLAAGHDSLDFSTAPLMLIPPSTIPALPYNDTIAMQWQATIGDIGVDTPSSSDAGRTSLVGMESYPLQPSLDSHWMDEHSTDAFNLTLDHQVPQKINLPAPPSAPHGRDALARLLDLRRDLETLHNPPSDTSSRPDVGRNNGPGIHCSLSATIEKVFSSTEVLVDIISALDRRSQVGTPPSHLDWQPDSSSTPPVNVDHSTMLLILSCYMRLLDIYESLADDLRANNHHLPTPPGAPPALNVPVFAMGGFKLATTSSTNVVMIIHAILEMVALLQMGIHVYVLAAGRDGGRDSQAGRRSDSREFPKYQNHSTVPSTETFLKDMLSSLSMREQTLVRNLSRAIYQVSILDY